MAAQTGLSRGRARRRAIRALRIAGGVVVMAALVAALFAVVLRYAGGWGVPYFTFTSERGSPCRNNLTGYTCTPLTLADVEFYSDLDLPDDTRVVSATYTATHDYEMTAQLVVPSGSADATGALLNDTYGTCHRGVPPLDTKGLSKVCLRTNTQRVTESGEPSSQIYRVGTGRAADNSLHVGLDLRSR